MKKKKKEWIIELPHNERIVGTSYREINDAIRRLQHSSMPDWVTSPELTQFHSLAQRKGPFQLQCRRKTAQNQRRLKQQHHRNQNPDRFNSSHLLSLSLSLSLFLSLSFSLFSHNDENTCIIYVCVKECCNQRLTLIIKKQCSCSSIFVLVFFFFFFFWVERVLRREGERKFEETADDNRSLKIKNKKTTTIMGFERCLFVYVTIYILFRFFTFFSF